jgi:hypothetical protein
MNPMDRVELGGSHDGCLALRTRSERLTEADADFVQIVTHT